MNSSRGALHSIAKILYDFLMPNKNESSATPVAVITGGTTGIGAATALELAKRGYNLLIVALDDPDNLEAHLKSTGALVEFLKIDLRASQSSAITIIDRTIKLFGGIDLLVNCAGVIAHKDIEQVTEADWDRIFAINLKAPFFLIQQAFPYLKLSGGSVINVSSTNAIHPMPKNQLYDSLKAALNNLTQGLALEFRDSGVRVNAIMPGGVRTPLVEQWLTDYLGRTPIETDFQIPSLANPKQIALVIAALASKEMSWINGSVIPVDGGFSLG